jgi:hypothetical protein
MGLVRFNYKDSSPPATYEAFGAFGHTKGGDWVGRSIVSMYVCMYVCM